MTTYVGQTRSREVLVKQSSLRLALLGLCAGAALVWGCTGNRQTTQASSSEAPTTETTGGNLLEVVKRRGVLEVSTDANYKPQSYRNADGSWVGFDIDVAREV